MAHTSTYEVNHYVYEKMTPEKRLDHWNKRFQLGSISFLQDEELMGQLGGQKQFLDIGQRSFNSYTFTRFHELVDRYGLVTGDRADCVEGVNLATIWTTYYHLPEDILTLDPEELWVRKYDCSAGWLDPPLCSWCWGMKSAILRIINPRLSFAWTKTAGLGDRCDGGSLCEGFYKLGEIEMIRGNYIDASELFEEARKYNPDDIFTEIMVPVSWRKRGRKRGPMGLLKKILEKDPTNFMALNEMVLLAKTT